VQPTRASLLYTSPTERRSRHIEITVDWATHDHRFQRRAIDAPPAVTTHWRLLGPTGKPLTCVTVRDAFGLELRVGCNDLDLVRSERVASPAMAAILAAEWKSAILEEGVYEPRRAYVTRPTVVIRSTRLQL
jgi:hypothetical protein